MSFDDYISCRVMNLLIETYINNAPFSELFAILSTVGVTAFECLVYLHAHDELYTIAIRKILDEYIFLTKDDLYDSHQQVEEYVLQPDILKKYNNGELGINELLVCKAKLYLEFHDISSILFCAAKNILRDKGLSSTNFENFLDSLLRFTILIKEDFHLYNQVFTELFDYDFIDIEETACEINFQEIKPLKSQVALDFFHSSSQKEHIENSLRLYADTPAGIGRMIQRTNLKKMYRKCDYAK